MLYVAAAAISAATFAGVANLPALIAAFFIFEVCVGMYFPSIGSYVCKSLYVCRHVMSFFQLYICIT